MRYLVFATLDEAEAAEADISAAMGLDVPRTGVNAATGLPEPAAARTERWAVPEQILGGRWIIPSPDNAGVEPGADWWPADT